MLYFERITMFIYDFSLTGPERVKNMPYHMLQSSEKLYLDIDGQ